MKFNLPNNNGKLPTDQHRAMKNYRLMQWAKVATFGLYMVAVFMLYVSDVWGVASFVTQNSNEFIALSVFSIISFVLAYFLASSKEAVYEDIALHRSEGWKLKPTQYAAMGLFLSSGILFEMFSTTNNQQHIANTAAEQSTMMKSIQGTDVSLLGSTGLTDSFASAQMKLAQCQERLARGKESHCKGAEARVNAVRESMAMSNELATTAAQQSVDNKVDGMLKIREHFDKPMFQAIGKATGTDNNSGMLMVIGVLIFIFECQHIMALFAYANSLARINRKDSKGLPADDEMKERREAEAMAAGELPSSAGDFKNWLDEKEAKAPMSAFANSAKQTVGEFAAKVEQGLKASPEIIATEYARADYANKQVLADAGVIAGKIGAKIDSVLHPPAPLTETDSFKQSPEQLAFVQREHQKRVDEYERAKQSALSGENTVKYLTPRLSVADTVKAIQANVKQSGATSPEAITAAVFDAFAAMPNPAPLSDSILERIAEKLAEKNAEKAIPTTAPSVPFHQQHGATGIHNPVLGTEEEHFPLPLTDSNLLTDAIDLPESIDRNLLTGQYKSVNQVNSPLTDSASKVNEELVKKVAELENELYKKTAQESIDRMNEVNTKASYQAKLDEERAEQVRAAKAKEAIDRMAAVNAEKQAAIDLNNAVNAAKQAAIDLAAAKEQEAIDLAERGALTDEQIIIAVNVIRTAVNEGHIKSLGSPSVAPLLKASGLPSSTDLLKTLNKLACKELAKEGLVVLNPKQGAPNPLYIIA